MKPNLQKGITLVEMLVYVGILVLVLGVIINSFIVLSNSYLTIRTTQKLHGAGLSAVDRINSELRGGVVLDDVNSTFGSHPGKVSITTAVGTTTLSVDELYIENGILVLDSDSTREGPLTPSDIIVSNLVFTRIDTSNGVAVKYDVTFEYVGVSATTSMTLHNTVVMRGAYQ
ncbi:hypothetical protein COB55_02600 [Candidatus Wolfebacteria bacterium]|nr:MAG: hypothetical protein COB55_02600 [Candidatus Wolfebacteria bacterium]